MTKHTRSLALLIFLYLPLMQACGGASAWEGTVTDSAGIAVVHNTATPLWSSGDAWTVTEELRIGELAGEPEYQFGQITFVDVADDGSIFVMDLMANQHVVGAVVDGSLLWSRLLDIADIVPDTLSTNCSDTAA